MKLSILPILIATVTAFVPRAATTFSTGLNAKENGRREFFTQAASQVAATATLVISPSLTNAVDAPTKPKIYTTDNGVKYAVLKQSTVKISKDRNLSVTNPKPGDLVVIDYTGYLSNGQIFDATHAEGKKSALIFKLDTGSVIPGIDDVVNYMTVGDKIQAIIPPALAYGDKGVCLENGECLVKPGATLVYDITLTRASLPPP